MKKRILIITAVVLSALLAGCIRVTISNGDKTETSSQTGAVTEESTSIASEGGMDFNYILIAESGSMAGRTVYYAEKTGTGVHLESYFETSFWDSKKEESVDVKRIIHERDGDDALYREIAMMAEEQDLKSWDGFSESDPDVMDGYGFSLEAELADGTAISAYGSNAYPDGYHGFASLLEQLCCTELIESTEFVMPQFTLTLPEHWVGNITVYYYDGFVRFDAVNVDTAGIMALYMDPYEEDEEGYIQLGSYEDKDFDETIYVSVKVLDEAHSPKKYESMTDAQKAVCDSIDEDSLKIADSVKFR